MEREYAIPHSAKLLVEDGQEIRAGDAITDGPINPQEYLDTRGKDAVQRYLVREVQRVYRSQGVTINDKHIEIIVRQMLKKVRIDQPGDCEQLPTELIDRLDFEEANNRVLAEGGEPATAQTVLLGVTKASLNTSSLPGRGLLPGDDPGAHRGRHQRRPGPPDRPQGERHHRQAHPGRVGRAAEHRRAQGAPAAGRPRGARRRGDRGPRRGGVQPVPRGRDARPVDDETAGLALAATIAGDDEDEADATANPFLAEATESERPRRRTFNPFLEEAAEKATADEA